MINLHQFSIYQRGRIVDYCSKPFEEFEIDVDGNCYCCCRWWNKSYCLGNIFNQTPDEIWNGKAAQELRQSILDGNYKYCNTDICLKSFANDLKYELITNYPKEISLCYDYTCTAKCVFCNDEIKKLPDIEAKKWDNIIDTKLIPLFKNANFVRLSMVGEVFISEHSKKLIKKIVKNYPNIKFEIVTNGIYATKENIEALGIQNNIENIKFSLPSIKEKTYKQLVRNGNLKAVLKNLIYISELRRNNKINDFRLNFIISSLNYKELPEYAENAEKLGAIVDCILLDKNGGSSGGTEFLKNFDFYNIANPNHPQYNSFINIINSKRFNKCSNININKKIQELKKVSLDKKLTNYIKYFFKLNKKGDI